MNRYQRLLSFCEKNQLSYDLAIESHDLLRGAHGGEVNGVSVQEENFPQAEVKIVKVLNEEGAQKMKKPIGTYITISSPALLINNRRQHQELMEIIAQKLNQFCPLKEQDLVLIAGLGNRRATPDALGPRLSDKILATRHLHGRIPEEILEGVRPVATLAPGVLGLTGIETAEMIKAVVNLIKPNLLIVCDALAAGDVSRIGSTVQIADTGINPGAGLGNERTQINQETIGIPVIALGVPTVVNGVVLAHNILESFLEQLQNTPHFAQISEEIPPIIFERSIKETIKPYSNNLAVTPKEIDDLIENAANVIAQSLSSYLHPEMNKAFSEIFI